MKVGRGEGLYDGGQIVVVDTGFDGTSEVVCFDDCIGTTWDPRQGFPSSSVRDFFKTDSSDLPIAMGSITSVAPKPMAVRYRACYEY